MLQLIFKLVYNVCTNKLLNPLLPSVLTEGVFLLNNSVFVLDLLARNCNQRFQLILLQTGLLFLTDPERLKVKRLKYQKQ